jgi:hypothetical protein
MKKSLLDRLRGQLLVEAQDTLAPAGEPEPTELGAPADPAAPEDPAAPDDPAADAEEEEEEKDESPIVHWDKHLQDIANDIRDTLQVKVELSKDASRTVPVGNDPDLGYHIIGLVHFPEGTPPDIKAKLKNRVLKYSAYVSPEGELSSAIDLFYDTDDRYESKQEPTFHVDSNQYRIVS